MSAPRGETEAWDRLWARSKNGVVLRSNNPASGLDLRDVRVDTEGLVESPVDPRALDLMADEGARAIFTRDVVRAVPGADLELTRRTCSYAWLDLNVTGIDRVQVRAQGPRGTAGELVIFQWNVADLLGTQRLPFPEKPRTGAFRYTPLKLHFEPPLRAPRDISTVYKFTLPEEPSLTDEPLEFEDCAGRALVALNGGVYDSLNQAKASLEEARLQGWA